ncbi:MAG: magnesium-transporting ATPase (P-type), partial [Bacillariaceae sp.]
SRESRVKSQKSQESEFAHFPCRKKIRRSHPFSFSPKISTTIHHKQNYIFFTKKASVITGKVASDRRRKINRIINRSIKRS